MLKEEKSTKFLGVIIDNKLKWTEHIQNILIKINRNIGLMWKLRNSLNKKSKILLYYTLIYCHLHYGNIVWGGAAKSHLDPIVKSQKKIIRIMSSASYRDHSHPLFKALGVLKLNEVNQLTTSKFIHSQLNSLDPIINFTTANAIHNYNTRRSHFLRPSRYGTFTNKFVSFRGCHIWNNLPEHIKNMTNINTFKINLKKHLLSLY